MWAKATAVSKPPTPTNAQSKALCSRLAVAKGLASTSTVLLLFARESSSKQVY
jgi:hypothetical protein